MARELAVTGAVHRHAGRVRAPTSSGRARPPTADVVVCDSLFPFVRSLSDWDNGEIAIDGFLAECTEAIGLMPFTVVYLDADVRSALALCRRSASRRDGSTGTSPTWSATRPTGDATDLDLAVGVLERGAGESLCG